MIWNILVIDIQERLLPAMHSEDRAPLLKQVANLVDAFDHFGGWVGYSEQYPKGLGPTVGELSEPLAKFTRLEKTTFSVTESTGFEALKKHLPNQIVLAGIEAHVCVLMTGISLLEAGYRVWGPFDAVTSRQPRYRDNGLQLLKEAGASIINTETLIFSELKQAGTADFKRFSRRIR